MTKETHSKGGYIFALLLLPFVYNNYLSKYELFYKIVLILIFIYSSYAGSLFPDIDMKGSYISKRHPKIYKHFGKKFKHRGFTHSIIYLYILCLIFSNFLNYTDNNVVFICISIGFIVGIASHIFLDFITKEGVQLLYPLDINFSILPIKTSSKVEKTISKVFNFVIIFLIGYRFSIFI